MRGVIQLGLLASHVAADTTKPRSIFSNAKPIQDKDGNYLPVQKTTEPRLEVSKLHQNTHGEWVSVRHVSGPRGIQWLSEHANGHPNTSVIWSNGTIVSPEHVHTLVPLVARWGWADPLINQAIWGGSSIVLTWPTVAGIVSGYVMYKLFNAALDWLSGGSSDAATTVRNEGSTRLVRRDSNVQNVYYHQDISNQQDTGNWPSGSDMQNAIHSGVQDMLDHDYTGACYDMSIQETGEQCWDFTFANLGFCMWDDGLDCQTPACGVPIGWDGGGGVCYGGADERPSDDEYGPN